MNTYTAEVALAQLVARKLEVIAAITFTKDRSAMISLGHKLDMKQTFKLATKC